jgi:hypothetical protein
MVTGVPPSETERRVWILHSRVELSVEKESLWFERVRIRIYSLGMYERYYSDKGRLAANLVVQNGPGTD